MISRKIKELRERKKLTQMQLSKLAGVSNIQIDRYENNISNPNFSTLERLAKALNVTPEYLLDDDPFSSNEIMDNNYNKLKKVINNKDDRKAFNSFIEAFYLRCVANEI